MKVVSLADLLVSQRSGYWGDEIGTSEADVRVIRNGDILDSGDIRWDQLPLRGFREADVQKARVALGDIILTTSGDCGYVAYIRKEPQAVTCATNFVRVLRFDVSRVFPRYIFHSMNRPTFRAGLAPFIRGTTMKNLAVGAALEHARLPLPSILEQMRIAEVLDRAEALRDKRQLHLSILENLAQSMFWEMFGDPVANPQTLPVRPMIDLVDPKRPISYGILMPGPNQENGVKYVRVVDMKNGAIDLSGIRRTTEDISSSYRRSLLRSGDLLMSIRGHVGRIAAVPPELDGANITQDTARLAVIGVSPIFVRECLRMQGLQQWMVRRTKGVAVRGINLSDVKLMPIIVPPPSSQNSFASKITAVERLQALCRASLLGLHSLVASLQHSVFRGEL